jgi:hypothetical protein
MTRDGGQRRERPDGGYRPDIRALAAPELFDLEFQANIFWTVMKRACPTYFGTSNLKTEGNLNFDSEDYLNAIWKNL